MPRKRPDAKTFDWLVPTRPARDPARAARREAMYVAELRDRAALLKRLLYDREAARARLRANVAWDFELHARPAFMNRIDAIVDEVYRRGAAPGGAPTT